MPSRCQTRLSIAFVAALAILVPAEVAFAQLSAQPATASDDDIGRIDAFVQAYSDAVQSRSIVDIDECIKEQAIVQRCVDGLDAPPAVKQQIAQGLADNFNWGRIIVDSLGDTGHYTFLKTHNVDGQPRALYRLVTADGGLNYHDMHLDVNDAGEVAFVDSYIYLAGEDLSTTFRRSINAALQAEQGRPGSDSADSPFMTYYVGFVNLVQEGKFEEAVTFYDLLPRQYREDKSIMLMRLQAAMEVNAQAVVRATDDFLSVFPDDPAVHLAQIDSLIYREKWAEAIKAIGRVRAAVGDDAYLDHIAANVYLFTNNMPMTLHHATMAIKKEPTLEEPHWTLLEVSLANRNHSATSKCLTTLVRDFDYMFDDLTRYPEYEHFVESDEFPRWLDAVYSPASEGLPLVAEPGEE